MLSSFQKRQLELSIRLQTIQLVKELRGLNITKFHLLTTKVINSVFTQVSNVLDQASSLANRALASQNPGDVLNNALLELKENLGSRIQQFQRSTEKEIERIVLDTLNKIYLGDLRGKNLSDLLRRAQRRIQARVGEIVSIVNRVLAL